MREQKCGKRHVWCNECAPEVGEKILEANRQRRELLSFQDRPSTPHFTQGQLVIIKRVLVGDSIEDIATEFAVSTRRVYHILKKAEMLSLLDLSKQVAKIIQEVQKSDPIWPYSPGVQTRAVLWICKNFANEKELEELEFLGVI